MRVALLLLLGGCVPTVFGTAWNRPHTALVIAWPDGNAGFLYAERRDHAMGPLRHAGPGELPHVSRPIGALAVVLPPDASPAARRRAEVLLAAVSRAHGTASTHLFLGVESWADVRTSEELARRVRHLRGVAGLRQDSDDPGAYVERAICRSRRDLVVVPLTTGPMRFVCFPGGDRSPLVLDAPTLEGDRGAILIALPRDLQPEREEVCWEVARGRRNATVLRTTLPAVAAADVEAVRRNFDAFMTPRAPGTAR